MQENISADRFRLEIERRNPLHAVILKKMLGERFRDHKAQEEWAAEYGRRISDIVDTPAHEDIRSLAREGKYEEAAEMVIRIIGEEDAVRGS
jgi:hypothetical protein